MKTEHYPERLATALEVLVTDLEAYLAGEKTMPNRVFADSFGDLEMQLSWGQSTDDFDDEANIRYDVYVNGRFEDVVFGSGGPRVIYGDPGDNLIEVLATDTAGNTSEAGTFEISL